MTTCVGSRHTRKSNISSYCRWSFIPQRVTFGYSWLTVHHQFINIFGAKKLGCGNKVRSATVKFISVLQCVFSHTLNHIVIVRVSDHIQTKKSRNTCCQLQSVLFTITSSHARKQHLNEQYLAK